MLTEEKVSGCNELDTYQRFADDIQRKKLESLNFLSTQRARGKQIFGFGAPVKGNTLLNHFGIGTDLLDCLVEKNSLRKGLVSPGMHIPVALENEISEPPDTYYVLAWNFKDEILQNNRNLIDAGVSFYFPVVARVQ